MSYLKEFRMGWQTLLASFLGISVGASLNHYLGNLFAPAFIAEFGWSKGDVAFAGTLGLASLLFIPLAGRFTDAFGPRVAIAIGFTGIIACYFAYTFMPGDIWTYYAIMVVQQALSILTTTLVFARLIVERFDAARGIALSILMTGAPIAGAVGVPIIGSIIDNEGWRAGYHAMAAITGTGGLLTLLLLSRRKNSKPTANAPQTFDADGNPIEETAKEKRKFGMKEFGSLLRQPVFLLLVGGMFLVNLPQILVVTQLKLLVMDKGVSGSLATWIVSLYASGVIVGRFLCGLALDRFAAHKVAAIALGMPMIGLAVLASPLSTNWIVAGGVLLIGLAQGGEGDLGAYLTSRKFPLAYYSFAFSFILASIAAASALGALLLTATLNATDSFNSFLLFSVVATGLGAFCFFLTGRCRAVEEADLEARR